MVNLFGVLCLYPYQENQYFLGTLRVVLEKAPSACSYMKFYAKSYRIIKPI